MAFSTQNNNSRLACPKDQGIMRRVDAGGVNVEQCQCCGGLWLDCGELERLAKEKPVADKVDTGRPLTPKAYALGAPGTRVCPRDGAILATMKHPQQTHVAIDRCPTCLGIFLDAGELKDLATFSLGERLRSLLE